MSQRNVIFDTIDEIYAKHAGPIAAIICAESYSDWSAQYSTSNLANLKKYIRLLLDELPNTRIQENFINELKSNASTLQIINARDVNI